MPEIVAVLDAGPLIHLDEIGRLDLLNDFKELLVPQAVLNEAVIHRPRLSLAILENVEIISESPPLPEDLLRLADQLALHAGERTALAVLRARGGQFLLSDDTAARTVAQTIGFEVRGTIGVLLRSQRRNIISKPEVLQILRDLPVRTTLHLRRDFLAAIIAKADAEAV